ncbi:anthocyanin 5-aromatic acyltransferase-like [Oryza glaberrima]|uniref:Uncharacterized protein n=1 Tax=Oryza glaberrima TaxID=4538 RepID=I1PZI2_ORYGL|nr:anthocyanin 5-aromatic acyltransferase-like [Oryza glaberrima]
MSSRSVRVVSVTHVQPEQTAGEMPPAAGESGDDGDDVVRLSFYDVMFVSMMPIQRLFFYEGAALPPFPSLVGSLRSSLAAALAAFLPLAGKLTFRAALGDVVLDYSAAAVPPGVKFVEAEYGSSDEISAFDAMRRLAGDVEHNVEAFMELVPELEVEQLPAPVLAVQVTRPAFRNDDGDDAVGVVAVGVSVHHAVADGQSLWQFMKAWSAAAMVGSPAAPGLLPPTFDRALIRHPRSEELASKFLQLSSPTLPEVKLSRVAADVIKGQRTRTFLLRADQIGSLKRRISRRIAAGEPPRETASPVTAYVAIASLVWTSVVRAKPHDAADEAYLMVTADCRRRLRPPIDPGYFGNCVAACYARANVGALRRGGGDNGGDDEGLARAAAAIGAAIREQLEDPLGGDIEGWLQFHLSLPAARLTAVGSSHRFMAYETDLGWGAPSRVELVSPFARELVMLLGAAGGGVQVSVSLDEAHMDAFETSWFQTAAGDVTV